MASTPHPFICISENGAHFHLSVSQDAKSCSWLRGKDMPRPLRIRALAGRRRGNTQPLPSCRNWVFPPFQSLSQMFLMEIWGYYLKYIFRTPSTAFATSQALCLEMPFCVFQPDQSAGEIFNANTAEKCVMGPRVQR